MTREIENTEQSYEAFFEDVWDYVSQHIVNDDMWETHEEKFQEITFDIYQFYKNTSYLGSTIVETIDPHTRELQREILPIMIFPMSPKICARMIESFVKNFKNELG